MLNEKKALWSELLNLKLNYAKGEWIVGEKRGRSTGRRRGEIEDFCSFIDLMELVDVNVVWSIHAWINFLGSASSRLDRFLLS